MLATTIGAVRELDDPDDLEAVCGGDTLCAWVAQGLNGRSRAWVSDDGRAVAAAGPSLSMRDRLAVYGLADAAVPLVRDVLAAVGPTYRPLGVGALIDELVNRLPSLTPAGTFGWMDLTDAAKPAQASGKAEWLSVGEMPEVADLIEVSFPASYAKPGVPGVERWAGVRQENGQLAAVGALAWSAPTVGFLAGVTVRPQARGRGLGRLVCELLLAEALRQHNAAALMVNDWNHAALQLYLGMGFRCQFMAAAAADCAS